jgi:hypothetical protein
MNGHRLTNTGTLTSIAPTKSNLNTYTSIFTVLYISGSTDFLGGNRRTDIGLLSYNDIVPKHFASHYFPTHYFNFNGIAPLRVTRVALSPINALS